MSTPIALSSSPPRLFARSPTSVESSPSLPSLSELFSFDTGHRKRFLPTGRTRDGFEGAFKSGKSLLGVKKGAENVTLRSPAQVKFKPATPEFPQRPPRFILEKTNSHTSCTVAKEDAEISQRVETRRVADRNTASENTEDATNLAQLDRAIPRRNDWTPPKASNRCSSDRAPRTDEGEKSFPEGLLRSFAFETNSPKGPHPDRAPAAKTDATHRHRIELLDGIPGRSLPKPTTVVKRKKSPAKKAMTITDLATSHYFGHIEPKAATPLMQYLSATQARTLDDDDGGGEGAIEGTVKSGKRKAKVVKVRKQKATVRSPKTAMMALEQQMTVFGSASQLAQDELKAPAQVEPMLTQQTQPTSVESITPKSGRGTSKFVKSRNLWSVAARDEANALHYVDTTDFWDDVGMAVDFTESDALVDCIPQKADVRGMKTSVDSPLDVDDFDSPPLGNVASTFKVPGSRSLHTSARLHSPSKAVADADSSRMVREMPDTGGGAIRTGLEPEALPKKPLYREFAIQDLRKQLLSLGFKPVRKREKMVEILKQHWRENYGDQGDFADDGSMLKHGDFLSNLHDVSSRPQPKTRRPRQQPKDKTDDSPTKVTKRSRKAKETDETELGPRGGRKRKKKEAAVSDEKIIDVDDIAEAIPTGPEGVGKLTPPPSVSVSRTNIAGIDTTGPDQAEAQYKTAQNPEAVIATPPATGTGSIGDKIHAAIIRHSEESADTDRNHVRDPTWHEKILLYDPIILEDLTIWLNTQGLGLVHEDREVSALEVRDWCEDNGICCLWRSGWRGNRSKVGDD